MTTTRIGHIPGAARGHCRGCGGAIEPSTRRRTWCSDACVTDALIRKGDPKVVRRELERRDRGVCADCGFDTAQVARVIRYLLRWRVDDLTRATGREAAHWLYRTVTGRTRYGSGHLWEADHIVAVVDGGGGCGLDGYATRCIPCHRRKTSALAKRRAGDRRAVAGVCR